MSRESNLVKNTIVLGMGNFLPKIVAIITLPILTAGLTKSEYGTYDLISTLVMLLIPIATLQMQSAAFRFLIDYRGDELKSKQIISNIFIVTIPITIITSFIIQFFFGEQNYFTRFSISLYFFVDFLYLASGQITRGLGDNKGYAMASIIVSVINMIGVVIGVKLTNQGLVAVIFSLAIANLIAIIFLFVREHIFKYLSIGCFSKKLIKELINYSWPMIPNNLSNWVLKLSDRLVITAALGVEANAIYAVANKIPNLLSMAQSIMVMAWQENASIAIKDKDAAQYFSKMFKSIFEMMIGATAILIGFTPVIFAVLIKGDYEEAYFQMPILILAMFFYGMSAFQGGIYVAAKKTTSVGITTMVAAAINLLIDLLFINVIGVTAGSLSTLVAYFVLYIYRMYDTTKFQKINYMIQRQVMLLAIIVIMLIICFFQSFWGNIINMLLGIIFFCFFNKSLIYIILRKIKEK